MAILGKKLEESVGLWKPGDRSVHVHALHERLSFEIFCELEYGLSSSVAYVIGCHVAKGFVITPPVVATDKPSDLPDRPDTLRQRG
jgi:hypothetical protein